MDPSLIMVAHVLSSSLLMLLGPLFCLSLFASYYPTGVIVPIVVTICAQLFISKAVYFWKDKKELIRHFYEDKGDYGTKEGYLILGISAMTSWIAPCTVWTTRKLPGRQGHIIITTFVTVSAYLMSLIGLGLLSRSPNFVGDLPIIHCFKSTDGFANKTFHFSQNTPFWKLTFSTDINLPKVRICSDDELPTTWLDHVSIVAVCLCALTQLTSVWLFYMSDFDHIYNYIGCANSLTGYVSEIFFRVPTPVDIKSSLLNQTKNGKEFIQSALFTLNTLELKNKNSYLEKPVFGEIQDELKKDLGQSNVWRCEATLGYDPTKSKIECPPLHAAFLNHRFILFIMLYVLGGNITCSNGQKRSPLFWLNFWLRGPTQCDGDEFFNRQTMPTFNEVSLFTFWALKWINYKHKSNDVENAVKNGDAELLTILLDNGYDPNEANAVGMRPLHLAAGKGAAKCLEILIENKVDVNTSDGVGRTPLHLAAWYGHKECVEILIKSQADIDARDIEESTPLLIAARNEKAEIIEILLENKACINVKDKYGHSPLLLATSTSCGNVECVRILVEREADVNAKNDGGNFPLLEAAMNGKIECLIILAGSKSADVNARDCYGKTLLHYCVTRLTNTDGLKILMEKKASVNITNKDGKTALHHVASRGRTEFLKILLENQALVNVTDNDQETPLHMAARLGFPECVKVLVENGADRDLQNIRGETCYDAAVKGRDALEQTSDEGEEKKNSKSEDFKKVLDMLSKQ